ncbi:alpha-amylase 1-like isoform X2 [Oratosquilla oratoria]
MNNPGWKCLTATKAVAAAITLVALARLAAAQWDPHMPSGRQVIVHLFEWKWDDIADECERFLASKGYGGVQVSPPTENVVAWSPDFNHDIKRPWWERYQPISYKLATRSGDENAFREMVRRCNKVGVRIFVDAVINHMTGWWPGGTPGTGGSYFDAASESYPSIPYSGFDFNDGSCHTASGTIENYQDANQVRNCKLSGLNDLDQGDEYVRTQIVNYMNRLLDMGVAGFRIDASKHMWPGDLQMIVNRLNNLNSEYFGPGLRPFVVQEVIDNGGEAINSGEYVDIGRVTEFKYSKYIGEAFHGKHKLTYLNNFGEDWALMSRHSAVVFVDNHDNQRSGNPIVTFREPRLYKMAVAYMLAWPYGLTRVMSSFYWDTWWEGSVDRNDWVGPPHDNEYNIISPSINLDDSCGNGWMCEHRWRQIYNMVHFRNVAHGTDKNDWWDNGNNQIAFCRGGKGFIAINNDNYDLSQTLQTCLSAGKYCDVISGTKLNGKCTGKTVTVGDDGRAYIQVQTSDYDGVLAIHEQSKL